MIEPKASAFLETGKGRGMKILIIGGLGLAAFLLAACATLGLPILVWAVLLGSPPDYPSSQEMISRYVDNKAEFERLARIMVEGKEVSWLGGKQCELWDGRHVALAENEECGKMAGLCRQLGIESAYAGPHHLSLYVASWGGAMGGSAIGYEYRSESPQWGLVTDVDNPGEEWSGRSRYQHIGGNWYIFVMID